MPIFSVIGFFVVSLHKISGASAITNKFDCTRLALSLNKISGASAISNKSLIALGLHYLCMSKKLRKWILQKWL